MRLKHRSGKSLVIILVACGVVSIAIGVGVGLFFAKGASAKEKPKHKFGAGSSASKEGDEEGDHFGHRARPEKEPGVIVPLGEMVVNLADRKYLRYAKVQAAVGFEEKVPEEKIKERLPVLKDIVINILSDQTFDDLHQKGALTKLKRAIGDAIQDRTPDLNVTDVYFEGFAMQ